MTFAPDYHIENFWLGFKQSMINFYTTVNMNYNHIKEWSTNLNHLQSKKQYHDIELSIRDHITYYSYDLIKYSDSTHHDDILITNIKRWNRISEMFNFDNSVKYSKILIIFMIILEFKKINEYTLWEEMIEENSYDMLIIWAFKNNKVKILELIKNIPEYNLIENIRRLYPTIEINDNMKMNKILKLIK
jgi:hypothetical protein